MDKTKLMWPQNKQFAFTVVDDTDEATLSNVKPVYDLLLDCGLITTKTIWPLRPVEKPLLGGDTLEDADYREWILELKQQGVEIAYHGVTDHTSDRNRTLAALQYCEDILGQKPRLYASHAGQKEAIYWGAKRFDGIPRLVFSMMNKVLKRNVDFFGDVKNSPYFWGDICLETFEYTRNLTFNDINTLKQDPLMPYHDPRRPFVKYWFSSSNGSHGDNFIKLISEANQDRLMEEGGACIAYTHFATRFMENGKLKPEFVRLIKRLATLPGWFVPASTILDHLKTGSDSKRNAKRYYLQQLQWRWMYDNLQTDRGQRYIKQIRSKFKL